MTGLPRPGAPDVIYLFDMHCWVYRFWHAKSGEFTTRNVVRFIGMVLRFRRARFAAVCRDVPEPTFRSLLAPKLANGDGYKAQREPPDPALITHLTQTHETLEDAWGVPVYGLGGFEADDLLASLARQAKDRGMRVVVVAADKDLMQLVDDRCVLWDGKDTVTGVEEVEARFGVRVEQLRDYLAICGDSTDNVPGLRGAGPKAAQLILSTFPTLDAASESALSEEAHPFWRLYPKYRSALRAQHENVRLSQRLVTLAHDAPITLSIEETQRE